MVTIKDMYQFETTEPSDLTRRKRDWLGSLERESKWLERIARYRRFAVWICSEVAPPSSPTRRAKSVWFAPFRSRGGSHAELGLHPGAPCGWLSGHATLGPRVKITGQASNPPLSSFLLRRPRRLAHVTGHQWLQRRPGDSWVNVPPPDIPPPKGTSYMSRPVHTLLVSLCGLIHIGSQPHPTKPLISIS